MKHRGICSVIAIAVICQHFSGHFFANCLSHVEPSWLGTAYLPRQRYQGQALRALRGLDNADAPDQGLACQ